MIYTTYFGNLRKLPASVASVAICRKRPSWWDGFVYESLAPDSSDFYQFKRTGNINEFVEAYLHNTLEHLDPCAVTAALQQLTGAEDIALVCYEKPPDFCHRHVVGVWMEQAGIPCKEYPYQ